MSISQSQLVSLGVLLLAGTVYGQVSRLLDCPAFRPSANMAYDGCWDIRDRSYCQSMLQQLQRSNSLRDVCGKANIMFASSCCKTCRTAVMQANGGREPSWFAPATDTCANAYEALGNGRCDLLPAARACTQPQNCGTVVNLWTLCRRYCHERNPSFGFCPLPTTPPPTTTPAPVIECGTQATQYTPKLSLNTASKTKIVGGKEALPHSWPWDVSITVYGSHSCGGSLWKPNIVISAAHCFPSGSGVPAGMTVHLGRHNINSPTPEDGQQTRQIASVMIHPEYDDMSYKNDIALVKLDTPISFDTTKRPICIPQSTDALPQVGTECVISGWGKLQFMGSLPDTLQEAVVQVLDMDSCNAESSYAGTVDPDTMFCAGTPAGGIDSCQGDSGGPLVCNVSGKWVQHGVVSWGDQCAAASFPGVYTIVKNFVDWLEKTAAAI